MARRVSLKLEFYAGSLYLLWYAERDGYQALKERGSYSAGTTWSSRIMGSWESSVIDVSRNTAESLACSYPSGNRALQRQTL